MQILMELNNVSKSHHYLPNDTIEHVFEIVSLHAILRIVDSLLLLFWELFDVMLSELYMVLFSP